MSSYLETAEGRRIAYDRMDGAGPGVVFLGGFLSDKEGTKALALQAWAEARGRAFLRFDYSGHGQSSGAFRDGAIGDWLADARTAIAGLTSGAQVLVGSSMGGWISLLLARDCPELVAGLVTIAAAPDFTDTMWAEFSEGERRILAEKGEVPWRSGHIDAPVMLSRRLIEDGRAQRVLDQPLALRVPVRLLQGAADADVPQAVAERLFAHIEAEDLRLTVVKGADHRFSTPACIALVEQTVEEVLARLDG